MSDEHEIPGLADFLQEGNAESDITTEVEFHAIVAEFKLAFPDLYRLLCEVPMVVLPALSLDIGPAPDWVRKNWPVMAITVVQGMLEGIVKALAGTIVTGWNAAGMPNPHPALVSTSQVAVGNMLALAAWIGDTFAGWEKFRTEYGSETAPRVANGREILEGVKRDWPYQFGEPLPEAFANRLSLRCQSCGQLRIRMALVDGAPMCFVCDANRDEPRDKRTYYVS